MPKGMMLKSDGFASNLSDPGHSFTLKSFCADRGIDYSDDKIPVRIETFSAYGMAFAERMVPELEDKLVVALDRVPGGYRLELEDGESITTRRVILAVGITYFGYVPDILAHLPPEFLSHSFQHHDLERFRGKNVTVIGGGSSASDLAGLLCDVGAEVQLVARRPSLKFHDAPPPSGPRSLWQRIRHPKSGLGPGLGSFAYSNAAGWFHYLPKSVRLKICRRHLGPAGGWFAKEKVIGRVPLVLGCKLAGADVRNGRLHIQLLTADGSQREIVTDHAIAATGYKVDVGKLQFLNEEIRLNLKTIEGTPVLSSSFESSVPGIYFVGVAAMQSFGPLMRFAYGSDFTARRVTRAVVKCMAKDRVSVSAPLSEPTTK